LLNDSPALSAGAWEAGVTTDQRGEPRENPPDIGAFELDNIGGGDGGGCAVGGEGRLDPTLPAMLAAALAFFGWRRRAGK
jgi:MYXO-CTERM domain-containing protein